MNIMHWLSLALFLGLGSVALANDTSMLRLPSATSTHEATGQIVSFGAERTTVKIAHDAIPGFMGAMTMSFEARTPTQLRDFVVDDRVVFSFTSAEGRRVIETIVKQPARRR